MLFQLGGSVRNHSIRFPTELRAMVYDLCGFFTSVHVFANSFLGTYLEGILLEQRKVEKHRKTVLVFLELKQ